MGTRAEGANHAGGIAGAGYLAIFKFKLYGDIWQKIVFTDDHMIIPETTNFFDIFMIDPPSVFEFDIYKPIAVPKNGALKPTEP